MPARTPVSRRLACLPALLCAALLALGAPAARAQGELDLRSFDAVPNKATPLQRGGILLEGASSPFARSFQASLLLDFNLGLLGLKLGDRRLGDLVPYRLDAHALFAYQVLPFLELGADVPVTLLQGDNMGLLAAEGFAPAAGPVARLGMGDVRLLARGTLLHPRASPVGLAAVLEARAPTGDARSFLGERGWLFAPRLALDVPVGSWRILGSLGVRLREQARFLQLVVDDETTFGAGVVAPLPLVGPFTSLQGMAEMHLSTPFSAPFNFQYADALKTPWEVLVGARGALAHGWGVELHVGRGVTAAPQYGRPGLRVLASARYAYDGGDRDGDGIADADDGCPDVPEDKDGFEDSDGCPDADNDQDGLPDGQDACPLKAGPPEYEGCPDTDEDQIPDNVDRCPDVPGPAENEGCEFTDEPSVVVESDRIRIRGNILFETGKAIIQKQSFKMLDEVATVLRKNADLGPVVIEGHTDSVGSRAYNQDLSDRRARAVLEYLVGKGIAKSRLRSSGFGEDRPVDTNDTLLGRAKNRRVDFRLIRDEKETTRERTLQPGEEPRPGEELKPKDGEAPPPDGRRR
jgi:outer membrane protein OmpA-like peptidoglycan-associated protein